MADPLSFISVANVVLRASAEVYRFLSEIKDAPLELDRLRQCVQETTLLVHISKQYLGGSRDRILATYATATDLNQALTLFTSVIRALDRELSALVTLAKKYRGARMSWGTIKWFLDQRKISNSLQRLENSKSTLNSALSLLGRGLSNRDQSSIKDAIDRCSNRISTELNAHQRALSKLKGLQEKLLLQQDKSTRTRAQRSTQTDEISKDLRVASQEASVEHGKTRKQVVDSSQNVIDDLSAKLGSLPRVVIEAKAEAQKSNREFWVIGKRQESMLIPLLLMKDHMRQFLLRIVSYHNEKVSSEDVYWLQSEFERLVSSMTQEVAALCQGSTATSSDEWNYSPKTINFPGTAWRSNSLIQGQKWKIEDEEKVQEKVVRGAKRRKRLYPDYELFSFHTPLGQILIRVAKLRTSSNHDQNSKRAGFSFIPHTNLCLTSITAQFSELVEHSSDPQIFGQLNVFTQVEDTKKHHNIFTHGTPEDVDTAFRNEIISPYDQDDRGRNVCLRLAALYCRSDLLRYLDSQGVGLSILNGETGPLRSIWAAVLQVRNTKRSVESTYETLSYIRENIDFYVLSPRDRLLQGAMICGATHRLGDRIQLLRTWMRFLESEAYNFDDEKDEYGRSPLLYHLSRFGRTCLAVVRLLLEFGANVHATDSLGFNAIQCAMRSGAPLGYWDADYVESPGLLEEKLSLMIECGVDVHHRDEAGETPSIIARCNDGCWDAWCRALERNRIDVNDVVQAEGNSWLLELSESEEEADEIEEEEGLVGNDESDVHRERNEAKEKRDVKLKKKEIRSKRTEARKWRETFGKNWEL